MVWYLMVFDGKFGKNFLQRWSPTLTDLKMWQDNNMPEKIPKEKIGITFQYVSNCC